MTPAIWLGVLIGAVAVIAVESIGSALVMTFLKDADMAEERTWTAGDDNELRRLALDLNGEA